MGLILDSSTLIEDERRRFDLAGFLETREEPAYIAAITASELLHGCLGSAVSSRQKERLEYVEWVLSEYDTVPFGLAEAHLHARLWAELRERGTMIGLHDLLIAATALSHGHTLATFNLHEFARVPGLQLIEKREMEVFRLA